MSPRRGQGDGGPTMIGVLALEERLTHMKPFDWRNRQIFYFLVSDLVGYYFMVPFPNQ